VFAPSLVALVRSVVVAPSLLAAFLKEDPMSVPKAFKTYAEFEREIIRPAHRIGLSLEEMVEDTSFDVELDLDGDPFEVMSNDRY
jgi:hypothetical protein